MLSFHVLCKNTYPEKFVATLLSLFVDPGAGVAVDWVGFCEPPEDASRAMAPTGVISDGGVVPMDRDAGVSDSGCPAPLSASEIPL